MYQTIKTATTYDQQVDLLEKRGLLIADRVKAKDVLSRLNYYTFTGYLHDFKSMEISILKASDLKRFTAL